METSGKLQQTIEVGEDYSSPKRRQGGRGNVLGEFYGTANGSKNDVEGDADGDS